MFERNRIAETLRNAREKRSLTLEDAARAAGIPLQYVRLLEGESDVRIGVSDELYLIPFFRKYASFMSIDPEELLPEFLGMLQQTPGDVGPPVRLHYRSRYASLWKPAAVLVTIGIAVTLFLRQSRERPTFEEAPPADVAAASTAHDVPATPQATTHDVGGPTATPTAEYSSPTVAPTSTPAVSGLEHDLTIAAKEDAWLALGVDDLPTKQYLLRAGESRMWKGTRFSLTVGNAGGVALTIDGRELPPVGRPGQVIRNLRLPQIAPTP